MQNIISETKIENTQIGISRPDELGAKINEIISPDIFANRNGSTSDLFNANFKCNISDSATLRFKFPEILDGSIPENTSFIYFMCNHKKLDPKRMVEYMNNKCSDILPFEITLDQIKYLGKHELGYGTSQDLFVVENGMWDRTKNGQAKEKKERVEEAFKIIKPKFREEALMVKFGDKKDLTKYLKSNPAALQKLDDESNYLLMIALKGTLRPAKRLKVADIICSHAELIPEGFEIEESDIMDLGTIRGTYKATGTKFDLDSYALKFEK